MSKMVLQVQTMNSVYEIDFEESRFRRLSGERPYSLATDDGAWRTFVEVKKINRLGRIAEGDEPFMYWFAQPEGNWLRTSLVQEQADIEYSTEGE